MNDIGRTTTWLGVAAFVLTTTPATSIATDGDNASSQDGKLQTRWAKSVEPDSVLPEYPRPQMVRRDWLNLNGAWDYAITSVEGDTPPGEFQGEILVPFCVESQLSGVGRPVRQDQALWYRRQFSVPSEWRKRQVLLHFGAVDWSSQVWVNGRLVGRHEGGYDSFSFDVTDALNADGPQTLIVKVQDPTDQGWQPRGKQTLEPEGIWYTAVTGIWQTVWVEPVPPQHIRSLTITPNTDRSEVTVESDVSGGDRIRVEVLDAGSVIVASESSCGDAVTLAIPGAKLWSPDSPQLYDLKVSLIGNDGIDVVQSYFGMRKISLGKHNGYTLIMLNDEPVFQFGPLDQGWWPDGLYTAPTDEAMLYDLQVIKKLGMNMLRKHVKVEPARFYYYCDKLGLLVWQDMPSGDRYIGHDDPDIQRSAESADNFRVELKAMIDGLRNHPSIIMWVVYNEGWGQWETARMAQWVQAYDPTRLVNAASGWADRKCGSVIDVHAYPEPAMAPPETDRASVLGEFGGLGWPVEGHLWRERENWGYRTYKTKEELQQDYLRLIDQLRLLIAQGLSAAVYTQTSDVEGEVNGLLTYDRAVLKLEPSDVAGSHRRLYLPPPRIVQVVPTSRQTPQSWRFTTEAPATGWQNTQYDDSTWGVGQGMFGKEGTPGVRVGTSWTSPDIWLRRTFELDEIPQGDLFLSVYHDEEAEVYINGVPAGTFRNWVTSHVSAGLPAEARLALKPGRNVLAVHCHQTGGGQGIDVGINSVIEEREQ